MSNRMDADKNGLVINRMYDFVNSKLPILIPFMLWHVLHALLFKLRHVQVARNRLQGDERKRAT